MSCDMTDGQTRKDRATQPLDTRRLSFVKEVAQAGLPIKREKSTKNTTFYESSIPHSFVSSCTVQLLLF